MNQITVDYGPGVTYDDLLGQDVTVDLSNVRDLGNNVADRELSWTFQVKTIDLTEAAVRVSGLVLSTTWTEALGDTESQEYQDFVSSLRLELSALLGVPTTRISIKKVAESLTTKPSSVKVTIKFSPGTPTATQLAASFANALSQHTSKRRVVGSNSTGLGDYELLGGASDESELQNSLETSETRDGSSSAEASSGAETSVSGDSDTDHLIMFIMLGVSNLVVIILLAVLCVDLRLNRTMRHQLQVLQHHYSKGVNKSNVSGQVVCASLGAVCLCVAGC